MNQSEQDKINTLLQSCRKDIEHLNAEIIKLIGKRFNIIRKVAKIKKKNDIPSFLADRIQVVIKRAVKLGLKHKIDPNFIYGMYSSMIMHSCLLEDCEMGKKNRK